MKRTGSMVLVAFLLIAADDATRPTWEKIQGTWVFPRSVMKIEGSSTTWETPRQVWTFDGLSHGWK